MRKIAVFLLSALLLTGCAGEAEQTFVGNEMAVAVFAAEVAGTPGETLKMQQKLARWYNVNLYSEKPDPGFEEAYRSILFFEDGVMGYVEIPKLSMYLPIFHGSGEGGFFHDPLSAFPIGGEGNHTVLTCDGELDLTDGDSFQIHVLGAVLTYRIGAPGADRCTLICDGVSYGAGRVVED